MNKERYYRISNQETPRAVQVLQDEAISTNHSDHSQVHVNANVNEDTTYTSSDMRRSTVRRHESRGSYSSVSADYLENMPGNGNGHSNDDHDADDEDDQNIHEDLQSPLSGEKSPLNYSFDSDERPSPPRLHFALDNDDDDFEEDYDIHLKRYAINFGKDRSVVADPQTGIIGYLWMQFQMARQQARQRRAQLLLEQSERHWRQSLYICLITTLCDATDGGIALAAVALLAWVMALWKLEVMRNSLVLGGLLVWTIRFGARPARSYWIQHRLRQYRPQTLPQYNDNGFDFAHPPPTMELSSLSSLSLTVPVQSPVPATIPKHHVSLEDTMDDPLNLSPKNNDPAIAII